MSRIIGPVWRQMRYPVKSMLGESLITGAYVPGGLIGDRSYALREVASGLVIVGKKPPYHEILHWQAATDRSREEVTITIDGKPMSVTNSLTAVLLSHKLGREVEVISREVAKAGPVQTIRPTLVLEGGRLTDGADVHLLTTAAVRWLSALRGEEVDWRRFRPNLYISAGGNEPVEDEWVGRIIRAGEVLLEVTEATVRCPFPMLAQGDLPMDGQITRIIKQQHDDKLGVYARVVKPGIISLGTRLFLED